MNEIITGDCRTVLPTLDPNSVDCILTDPPYGYADIRRPAELLTAWLSGETYEQKPGYMGLGWDVVPGPDYWRLCARVLKPGAFLAVFAGAKTFDLVSLALRLAGLEKREAISIEGLVRWYQGQGMAHGDHLKPCWESVLIFRKPAAHTNHLLVERTRVGTEQTRTTIKDLSQAHSNQFGKPGAKYPTLGYKLNPPGRYPPNVLFVHRPACSEYQCDSACTVLTLTEQHPAATKYYPAFRYQPKPGRGERAGHPTQKPLALCQWLCRLLVPPGSLVLDPFTGIGTIPLAALREGCSFIGIESDLSFAEQARERVMIGDHDGAAPQTTP